MSTESFHKQLTVSSVFLFVGKVRSFHGYVKFGYVIRRIGVA